jgi:tetratricopeptide (TPR) repeat protein
VLINSGVLLIRLGRIAEGIERCRKAEKLFEVLKEVRGQIICALNISAAAFSMGNYELAKSAARRNLELAQAIANEEFMAFAYANLGRAERELGELESAIAHMRAGLELRRVIADPVQMVTNWSDLVIAYLRLGDVESARRDTEAMLALIAACADQLREPQRPLWAAAQTFHQLGDSPRATNFLTQAHAALLAKAAEVPDSESRTTFLAIPYNHEILAAFEGNEWPSNPRHRP